MKTPNLIRNYEQSVNALVKAFCQKQYVKFDSDMWADRIGGIILINHYYLSFDDILYDMQTEQPKGKIFEFHNYLNQKDNDKVEWISYEEYCKK